MGFSGVIYVLSFARQKMARNKENERTFPEKNLWCKGEKRKPLDREENLQHIRNKHQTAKLCGFVN